MWEAIAISSVVCLLQQIFICLTAKLVPLASFKAQIPDCCKDWRADTVKVTEGTVD